MTRDELANGRCVPCRGEGSRLDPARAAQLLAQLPGWEREGDAIGRTFRFGAYEETLAFVNRVAQLAQAENHHPDISFGYNRCRVSYSTHSVGGLSMNDFICAAKVEALLAP
jgi:4a-hydroxytetrahydrobiopterin dehydratase